MRSSLKRASFISVLSLTAGLGAVSTAGAATPDAVTVTCGQTITRSIGLAGDVGPCRKSDGIVIGADNVSVNLNRHRVLGDADSRCDETPPKPCDAVGILIAGRKGVRVVNGTVKFFDAGVAVQGGSGNTLDHLTVTRNIGSGAGQYGDGIALDATSGNKVSHNTVTFNGPFSGVGLPDGSSNNVIDGNVIDDNAVVRQEPVGQPPFNPAPDQEDQGLRVEPFSSHNVVSNNEIARNGSTAVAIVFDAVGNVVRGNTIKDNGGPGVRASSRSDGTVVVGNTITGNGFDQFRLRTDLPARIRGGVDFVFAQHNRIIGNVVNNNAVTGIEIGGGFGAETLGGNLVRANTVRRNGASGIVVDCPISDVDFTSCIAGPEKNRIIDNHTGGNGTNDAATGNTSYDLLDRNINHCDANVWMGNTFDTAFPKCTRG